MRKLVRAFESVKVLWGIVREKVCVYMCVLERQITLDTEDTYFIHIKVFNDRVKHRVEIIQKSDNL